MPATPTRERLVTEAMKLFSERGFEATSVSQIEAAAGLSAGSAPCIGTSSPRMHCWRRASTDSWTAAQRCRTSAHSSVASAIYAAN